MRTLAIDYGTRRIGLAMSDEGGRFATPVEVLQVQTPASAIDQILTLIKKESVARLVIGLPLNMDDTIGPAAKGVLQWARQLATAANVELVLVDERLSSFDAEQQLSARRKSGERLTRQMKKDRLDAIAAANFLQAFLDGRLPALRLGE